jgi:hypothetical protein
VTGIPRRTVQRWAATKRWQASSDDATEQAPDQRFAGFAAVGNGAAAAGKGNGASAPPPPSGSPGLELAQDLALARAVYRLEAGKVRDGRATSLGAYRDAAVALGILTDKARQAGVPGVVGAGAGWSWDQNRAQARASLGRLRELVAIIRERAEAQQREDLGG